MKHIEAFLQKLRFHLLVMNKSHQVVLSIAIWTKTQNGNGMKRSISWKLKPSSVPSSGHQHCKQHPYSLNQAFNGGKHWFSLVLLSNRMGCNLSSSHFAVFLWTLPNVARLRETWNVLTFSNIVWMPTSRSRGPDWTRSHIGALKSRLFPLDWRFAHSQ